MPALSEYSNVDTTALNILKLKGYSLWYDEEANLYNAEKDGWDFIADSPCGLLGIIGIYEWKKPKIYTEYWWKVEEPDPEYSTNLSTTSPPFISISEAKNT